MGWYDSYPMHRWHAPLDPACPVVLKHQHDMEMDPMNYSIPADVLADIDADFARRHRAHCERCQNYGAANIE